MSENRLQHRFHPLLDQVCQIILHEPVAVFYAQHEYGLVL